MSRVLLRDIRAEDLDVLFENQRDPESVEMAAFPARDREAFDEHWSQILADPTVVTKAVVCGGTLVGGAVSFVEDGRRMVGYWIGREHWGRGFAGDALSQLVDELAERPLYAEIAAHNEGSMKVARRAGFQLVGEREETRDGLGPIRLLMFALP